MKEYQASRTGMDAEFCDKILNAIDLTCITLEGGWNASRYPKSFKAASYALDVLSGRKAADEEAAEWSYQCGRSVFDAPYFAFDGVKDMLIKYRSLGYRLIMYSKGDIEVQRNKVTMNDFDKIFGWESIHIVEKKNGEKLQQILDIHKIKDVKQCVMIGDSAKDDVGSAIEVGMDSVLVHNDNNTKWAYEDTKHAPTYHIGKVTDITTVLPGVRQEIA
jgi:HAD superfamily hydrolase (TIGR01549 family)